VHQITVYTNCTPTSCEQTCSGIPNSKITQSGKKVIIEAYGRKIELTEQEYLNTTAIFIPAHGKFDKNEHLFFKSSKNNQLMSLSDYVDIICSKGKKGSEVRKLLLTLWPYRMKDFKTFAEMEKALASKAAELSAKNKTTITPASLAKGALVRQWLPRLKSSVYGVLFEKGVYLDYPDHAYERILIVVAYIMGIDVSVLKKMNPDSVDAIVRLLTEDMAVVEKQLKDTLWEHIKSNPRYNNDRKTFEEAAKAVPDQKTRTLYLMKGLVEAWRNKLKGTSHWKDVEKLIPDYPVPNFNRIASIILKKSNRPARPIVTLAAAAEIDTLATSLSKQTQPSYQKWPTQVALNKYIDTLKGNGFLIYKNGDLCPCAKIKIKNKDTLFQQLKVLVKEYKRVGVDIPLPTAWDRDGVEKLIGDITNKVFITLINIHEKRFPKHDFITEVRYADRIVVDASKIKNPDNFGFLLEKTLRKEYGQLYDINFILKRTHGFEIVLINDKKRILGKVRNSLAAMMKKFGTCCNVRVGSNQPPTNITDTEKAANFQLIRKSLEQSTNAGLEPIKTVFNADKKAIGFIGAGATYMLSTFIERFKGSKIASLVVHHGGEFSKDLHQHIKEKTETPPGIRWFDLKAVKGHRTSYYEDKGGGFAYMVIPEGTSQGDRKAIEARFGELDRESKRMVKMSLVEALQELDDVDSKKDVQYYGKGLLLCNASSRCLERPLSAPSTKIRLEREGGKQPAFKTPDGRKVEVHCQAIADKLRELIPILEKLGVAHFLNDWSKINKETSKQEIDEFMKRIPSKEKMLVQFILDLMIFRLVDIEISGKKSFSEMFSDIKTKEYERTDVDLTQYGKVFGVKNPTMGIRNSTDAYKVFSKVLTKLGIDPTPFRPF